jgi:hypothetical protein
LNGKNRLWSWFWTAVEVGGVPIKRINVKRQLGLNAANAGKFGIQSHFIGYENILFLIFKWIFRIMISISNSNQIFGLNFRAIICVCQFERS